MIKERPIIFNTEMTQAILDGRKDQTRRVVKGKNLFLLESSIQPKPAIKCPYGKPGDVLYVKETFAQLKTIDDGKEIVYKSDIPDSKGKWTSSLYMPKSVARIFLEIESVRIEQLQEISKEDAHYEGLYNEFDGTHIWYENYGTVEPAMFKYIHGSIDSFKSLWDKINGKKYPWIMNPYVWVIDFKIKEIKK